MKNGILDIPQNGNGIKRQVLLAEDNPAHAELFIRNFKKTNSSILHLSDGEQVLDYLRQENFDEETFPHILFLDLRLPRVDGLEVLHNIKSDRKIRSLPVVIYSSSDDPRDVSRAYQYGANSYLVKPINPKELVSTLQSAYDYWVTKNKRLFPPALDEN